MGDRVGGDESISDQESMRDKNRGVVAKLLPTISKRGVSKWATVEMFVAQSMRMKNADR